MNKRTKKLVFAVAILFILCLSYILFVPKEDESSDSSDSSSDESEDSTKIADFDEGSITAISFNGINLVLSDDEWIYADSEDYPVDNDAVSSLAEALADLSYSDLLKISEVDDLSIYGFEKSDDESGYDNLTLEVSFTADDTEYSYYVGEYNSIVGEYYMTLKGDENIYMIDTAFISSFSYDSIYDLLVVDTIPEIDAAYITGMAVVTPETSYTFTVEAVESDESSDTEDTDDAEDSDNTDEETEEATEEETEEESSVVWYVQTTDIAQEVTSEKSEVDLDTFSTVVDNILSASSYSAAAYNPSDDELTAYGLSIPAYTIIITYIDENSDTEEEKTFMLSIGSSDENGYLYAIINDSEMIVSISDIDFEDLF